MAMSPVSNTMRSGVLLSGGRPLRYDQESHYQEDADDLHGDGDGYGEQDE
jgi:hypothetical protein